MPRFDRKLIGEMLIEDGLITKEQLTEALNLQRQSAERLPIGELLVQLQYLTEEGLALTLSRKIASKYLSFSDKSIVINYDQGLDGLIDEKFANNNMVLPLNKTARSISIAMWDPLNFTVIDNIKKSTALEPVVYCSTKKDILEGIERLYVRKGAPLTEEEAVAVAAGEKIKISKDEAEKLKLKASEAPVVKIVNALIQEAVRQKASDIHIEPREDNLSIRYRIDGILYETRPPSKDLIAPMISRIKILSRVDIAEKRLPQDGGFMVKVLDRSIDLRVSTIPTIYGEKVAVRILDKDAMSFKLDSIGFGKEDFEKISANIRKPHGLVFLTGPTGSGKTTTLYCILNEIISSQKNIVTIEDPVEYRIDGINQVQAQPGIGLTFAAGLRSFLRQDPDVIMVGEVRDLETAEICVRAALVGRLVLSTLHTNDSVGSITRLIDFGIEPFLVGSTLNMVIAQRLVRRLCDVCKEPARFDQKTIDKYKLKDAGLFIPKGCASCHNRGYTGRIAIFEIMVVDDEIRRLIEKREDTSALKNVLIKKRMRLLRDDGLDKARQGLTSLDEVLVATMEEM